MAASVAASVVIDQENNQDDVPALLSGRSEGVPLYASVATTVCDPGQAGRGFYTRAR